MAAKQELTRKVAIGRSTPIAPTGDEGETDALDWLLAYFESDGPIESEQIEPVRHSVTPWVAQQLGVMAEILDEEGKAHRAARMALLAIRVAEELPDQKQLMANLLTGGNIWFKQRNDNVPQARDIARDLWGANS